MKKLWMLMVAMMLSVTLSAAESDIDGDHTIQNGDISQAGTATERTIANRCHTARDSSRSQALTTIERTFADGSHTVRNGNGSQADTATERAITNGSHAVRDGNRSQAVTAAERTTANGSHSGRNNIAAGNITGCLNQHGFVLVKQNTVLVTAVVRIVFIHPNSC